MNIHDLRTAQAKFQNEIDAVIKFRKPLHAIRRKFVAYYNPIRIKSMHIDQYAIGNDLPDKGFNFCYTLERQLDGLGRIIGATAFKFGVYYGSTKSDHVNKYRFTKKYGKNYHEAFDNVKDALHELIEAGRSNDVSIIVRNPISPMFKGKILSTYFPERYLNVFGDEHLEYFLIQLNLDVEGLIWSDAVIKREALVAFKNSDPIMREWTLDLFAYFLYRYYPGRPPKRDEKKLPSDPLAPYIQPDFPANPITDWVNLEILPPNYKTESTHTIGKANVDYEQEQRKNKKYGDRGEKLAIEMEVKRLNDLGKGRLASKVKKAEFDYLGYDIYSFEENGDPRYIEVKATSSKVGVANFFLSSNELHKAQELRNYYIYMVYDILSTTPKIWIIPNPFSPVNENIKPIPTNYRISINAKKY